MQGASEGESVRDGLPTSLRDLHGFGEGAQAQHRENAEDRARREEREGVAPPDAIERSGNPDAFPLSPRERDGVRGELRAEYSTQLNSIQLDRTRSVPL